MLLRGVERSERRAIKNQTHADLQLDLALIVLGNCPYSATFPTVQKREEAYYMANVHLTLVSPATEKRTVTPRRRPNSELRPREHLTEREVEMLIEAAKRQPPRGIGTPP